MASNGSGTSLAFGITLLVGAAVIVDSVFTKRNPWDVIVSVIRTGNPPPKVSATVGTSAPSVTGSGASTAGSTGLVGSLTAGARAAVAVAYLTSALGKPYKVGPGRYGPDYYDCSGLTYAAAKAAGVTIGTVSYDQANDGTAVPMDPAYVRPGDLIIMNSTLEAPPWAHNGHVGMAVSSTEMIVAPHTGDVVKREPIPFGNKMILSDIRRIFQ